MKYKIKKNNHYSYNIPRLFISKEITKVNVEIKFTDSCLYSYKNHDSFDINKLYGWSEGYHKNNSFRIGWRGTGNMIEVFAFMHENGKILYSKLGDFLPNIYYSFEMEVTNEVFKLSYFDQKVFIFRKSSRKCKLGYVLFPYFGGNNKAPHDIHLEITKLC